MTDQQHPITPPPELIAKWASSMCGYYEAARWGADQELDACITWVAIESLEAAKELRATRRPKPPNKKQRGLTALEATNLKEDDPLLYQEILNAIEGLPDD